MFTRTRVGFFCLLLGCGMTTGTARRLIKRVVATTCAYEAQHGRMPVFGFGSNGLEQVRDRCKNPSLKAKKASLPGYVRFFAGENQYWQGGVASLAAASDHVTYGSVVFLTEAELLLLDSYEVNATTLKCRSECDGEGLALQACRQNCAGSGDPWAEDVDNFYHRILVPVIVHHQEGGHEKCDAVAYVMNRKAGRLRNFGLRWQKPPGSSYVDAIARNLSPFWPGLDFGDAPSEGKETGSLVVYGMDDANGQRLRRFQECTRVWDLFWSCQPGLSS